jgi:multidrug resistance efflux pump
MRGRGLMLVAGMKMGQNQAKQQAAAQQQQQAAVEQAKQQGAAEAMAAAPAAPAAAPAGAGTDVTAQLQKLADLHKSGVLSDEEFAAAKKKLLS